MGVSTPATHRARLPGIDRLALAGMMGERSASLMGTHSNSMEQERGPVLETVDGLTSMVRRTKGRVAMPILAFPGARLIGATVRDLVTDAQVQAEAQAALHERYQTAAVMSAMDLSIEAEVFGSEVRFLDQELPVVAEGRIRTDSDIDQLRIPSPGDGRTAVALETVRRLSQRPGHPLVLGGCIGPFSLTARLIGLSEALGWTITEPARVERVMERVVVFLSAYVRALREAGAAGVIMAEPSAGLLSPRAMSSFSSAYVRRLVGEFADASFAFVLHNCAARLVHLDAVLESGACCYHFGAPMDMVAALSRVGEGRVLCGNLDPAAVFCQASPETVREQTRALLAATGKHRDFVISSGCDIPPATPLENVDAFYDVMRG
jgi:uroporphyrinogen decarboxylase